MAKNTKAREIGEVLQALAYHEFDFIERGVFIRDYDHILSASDSEPSVLSAAEDQSERHLQFHHGIVADGEELQFCDDWCMECTKEFLPKWLGRFSEELFKSLEGAGDTKKLGTKEKAIGLVIHVYRDLETRQQNDMRQVTQATGKREGLGSGDAETIEALIRDWNGDDDRVTDFYAEWLGQKFAGIVDRAEKLNSLPARAKASEAVRRYLVEASRCYVLGQYIACLVLCRAAIELALADFLVREGKDSQLQRLKKEQKDGLAARIALASTLKNWKLKFTLDAAGEIRRWAGTALHEGPVAADNCKELFFKARGVLRDLYS